MENKKKDNKLVAKTLRRGRPKKEKKKLSVSINLKLTEQDYDSIKEKAEKLGMKPTQYAREMTLKGGIKSRFTLEELDLMRNLAGMSNNLNQVAKQANKSGFTQVSLEIAHIAFQIRELLDDR
ncbi:plasmid mobilization protein [Proteiniphilum propionicum]|uniref:plasmid mobilization protein n=1 Tax=Proteiniphilum propionicum TaxID=2829812 RepID=UPI001EE9F3E8|nr:plasmid mobilization relaxosome protein MobC [Proteiniphilum propionicum]MDD4754379.1 plasmid mobilization relaxosome protein MobC [Desulfitobacteriaceae bacterium]ULB35458.1 plasmid mobilization relaxosome protein MobC [Proteiniphilum propionicum]